MGFASDHALRAPSKSTGPGTFPGNDVVCQDSLVINITYLCNTNSATTQSGATLTTNPSAFSTSATDPTHGMLGGFGAAAVGQRAGHGQAANPAATANLAEPSSSSYVTACGEMIPGYEGLALHGIPTFAMVDLEGLGSEVFLSRDQAYRVSGASAVLVCCMKNGD